MNSSFHQAGPDEHPTPPSTGSGPGGKIQYLAWPANLETANPSRDELLSRFSDWRRSKVVATERSALVALLAGANHGWGLAVRSPMGGYKQVCSGLSEGDARARAAEMNPASGHDSASTPGQVRGRCATGRHLWN